MRTGMPARLVRVTGSGAVLFAAAVTVIGQQPDGQPQTPTFRGGVDAVQIDAFVTDANGRPVRGLTVDDFEVYREEQAQPITTFATVDIPVVKSPAPLIADEPDVAVNTRPDGRIYMFMLSTMSPDMALRTRHLLRRFMDQYFGDNDMAAVVVDRGLVTDGQDFTYSRRLILQAIDKWGGGGGTASAQRSEAEYTGAQGLVDRGISEDLRGRMEFFTRIPGHRKFVLWFTDNIGFDAYDVVDYHGGVPSLAGEHLHAAVAAATRGNIRIYPISPMGLNSALGQAELERRNDLDVPDFSAGDFTMSGISVTTAQSDQTVTLKGESDRTAVKKGQCQPPVCSPDTSSGVFVSQWAAATKSPMLQTLQRLPTPPTTDRTMTKGETLGLFVEVYDNNKRVARDPAYQITVNAALLDASGQTVRQVSDRRSSQAARGASGGHGFSMLLPLTQVPAGDYVIQVESQSERNPDHVETRRIPVRVEASGTSASRGTS